MLDAVGIADAKRRVRAYPHEFSGGMCQRVMLAIAMVCKPKLLIADEPTTALDVTVQKEMLRLMKELQREFDLSILFITHDLGVVAEMCDEVSVMYAGQVVESTGIDELFTAPGHPYTEGLLDASQIRERVDHVSRRFPVWCPRPGCGPGRATSSTGAPMRSRTAAAQNRSHCSLDLTVGESGVPASANSN